MTGEECLVGLGLLPLVCPLLLGVLHCLGGLLHHLLLAYPLLSTALQVAILEEVFHYPLHLVQDLLLLLLLLC